MSVEAQYEAFPYPARDPAEEASRLITGSPSHPLEVDHFLFRGQRDWSRPFRALVAGGGTGDGLIQLAQVLTSAGRPHEIVYLDLSAAARRIAEARAAARGLTSITFVTGSLMQAGDHGPFDYVDCCGVLHHLEDPDAGLAALAAALAPGGGMGLMVYAPHGRAGVYPLQEAFGALLPGPPAQRLKAARAIFDKIPAGHPIKTNPHLGDHKTGDAGFYDLLLHSRDRAYPIEVFAALLERAGLRITGMPQAIHYDPRPLLPDPALIDGWDQRAVWALAEKLRGTIKTHIVYAAPGTEVRAAGTTTGDVPHLKGAAGAKLAEVIARSGVVPVTVAGERHKIPVPAGAAPVFRAIDGRRTLGEIAAAARLDPIAFNTVWGPVSRRLVTYGLLWYSTLLRGV